MSERNYFIKIIGKEGEYLKITDSHCKYKTQIHESIIADNNYDVIDNEFKVSADSFNLWFKEDIEAETKRIRDERFNLFYPNIPLFWRNRKLILKEPRYYSIKTPETLFDAMYCDKGLYVTLGELLQIWENEAIFSVECNTCGGKSVIYRFGGSPLSGTLFEKKAICLQCGKTDNLQRNGSFGQMQDIRAKYSLLEPIAETPASLQELVEVCKKSFI